MFKTIPGIFRPGSGTVHGRGLSGSFEREKNGTAGNPLDPPLLHQQVQVPAGVRPINFGYLCDLFSTEASIPAPHILR